MHLRTDVEAMKTYSRYDKHFHRFYMEMIATMNNSYVRLKTAGGIENGQIKKIMFFKKKENGEEARDEKERKKEKCTKMIEL